ncbi:MAG: D-tyrosyl-tRNA(Tyr) deacylase [Chlamydiia bacterium]|nr:D-tyrosyl-tRNA(Tyr) deacylase [Chlamydiia bacterium]
MKVLIQRVTSASVQVDHQSVGAIGPGLLLFLGIHPLDTSKEVQFLTEKVANLRIFTDESGKMNFSVQDLGLDVLVVSQFTLYANCLSGRRPDFIEAASPQIAEPLYQAFIQALEERLARPVARGVFGAKMEVSLLNDGPVTMMIERNPISC